MSSIPDPSTADGSHENPTRTIQTRGDTLGTAIGPYELIRQIGEGGMGVVYHARQLQPIRRDVAVKIIKPGMDSKQVIARFESERQALAMMDHPHIARVFDAGATAWNLPFFVMELVDGVPITRYCDSKRLTIAQRVELFILVCRAIQHAHQKGIIHRDIKPSNILVQELEGKPVPKVIDFGLAKALGQQLSDVTMMTNLGTVVGTLDYMSPEQAEPDRRDVDTRSDVYSLGAVLYELLTGTTPLERDRLEKAGYVEVLQHIRDGETPPPSTRLRRSTTSVEVARLRQIDPARLTKILHGELDWIALKALEKDRTRRYETVNGLARDLERYLAGEPVEAVPPSAAYKMRKFVRKHRAWLATAAAFTALLLAGVVVSSWMAVRARRAEQEAIQERNTAAAVNGFLENDLLSQASALNQREPGRKPDPDLKVRTVLDRSAERIEGKFGSQPAVEASVRLTMGGAYYDLGLYAQAARQLERSIDLRRRTLGPEHPDTLIAMDRLIQTYREQGRYPEAQALGEKVLAAERRTLGEAHRNTLITLDRLATIAQRQGKFSQAEAFGQAAMDGLERTLGPENPDTISAMSNLAAIYTEQAKYGQAEALFTKVLNIERRVRGPDHPDTLATMSDLSVLYSRQHKYAEAEELTSQALEGCRRVFGPDHPNTLLVMSNLAVTYSDRRKYAESEALNQQTLGIMRRVLGAEHPSALIVMNNLGVAYKSLGKYAEAESLDSQLAAITRRVLGPDHPNALAAQSNLALDYFYSGKYRQAETLFRELLAARRRSPGPNDPGTLRTVYHLAMTLYSEGQYDQAEALLRNDLEVYDKAMHESWERSRCQSLLGATLAAQGKYAAGEPLLLDGVQGLLAKEAQIPWYGVRDPEQALGHLIDLYRAWGQTAQAAEWRSKLEDYKRARKPGNEAAALVPITKASAK